jgi:23S rRNA (uracil1939-C5)-methyltransferase
MQIERLVGGGLGLAHHDGKTWMIRGGLPDEEVNVIETHQRSGVCFGAVQAVLSDPHIARSAEPCRHMARCGGCDWAHIAQEHAAELKKLVAIDAARRFPHLARHIEAAPFKSSPLNYRLRSRLHWDSRTKKLGFFAHRSWTISSIDGCRIISPLLASCLDSLRNALSDCCAESVDVDWLENLSGERAAIAIRAGQHGPEHLEAAFLPSVGAFDRGVEGCALLKRDGSVMAARGETQIIVELPTHLRVPVGSFFQVNRHLVPWLFRRVSELVGADRRPTWDLHAGVGFLASAARFAEPRELVLVEPSRPAAKAAQHNLPDARVRIGQTAESYLSGAKDLPRDALVITDPPRSGMSGRLRELLAGWRPQRLLMLACDTATWARDTAFLTENGYKLVHLELVDLFPSTHHVEILAILEAD